jgi:hypothetical protein
MDTPTQTFRPFLHFDVEAIEQILRTAGMRAESAKKFAPRASESKAAKAMVHAWIEVTLEDALKAANL